MNLKDWRLANPEKYKAHMTVNNAVRSGKLIRQSCEVCGNKAHAHHDDYTKPLLVRWLCSRHHTDHHYPIIKPKKQRKKPRLEKHSKYQPFKPNPLIPFAKKLREEGMSYGKIAKQLSVSRSQCFKWCNDKHN